MPGFLSLSELWCHMFHCCLCPKQLQELHTSAMSSFVIFRSSEMRGLCFPEQQGEFENSEIWPENTKAPTLNSGNTPTPVLERPFNAARVPHCEIHMVSGSFISEEHEQRQDRVPHVLSKPACHTSTWQALPQHTTICFCLLQVCFFSCSPFLSVFSPL